MSNVLPTQFFVDSLEFSPKDITTPVGQNSKWLLPKDYPFKDQTPLIINSPGSRYDHGHFNRQYKPSRDIEVWCQANGIRDNDTGSIYQDKDGYWNARFSIGRTSTGAIKYKKFRSKNKKTVVTKMKEFMLNNNLQSPVEGENTYLDEFLKAYIISVKKIRLKATSYDRVYRTYELHISPRIGFYRIRDLTSSIIQSELINDMLSAGYSYSSIHKSYILLNECLRYAVQNNVIHSNPCTAVVEPNKKNFELKEVRFLTDEEIHKFVSHASLIYTTGKPRYIYGKAITLIIYTGLRGGELCGLKWKDINFETKTLTIKRNTAIIYKEENGKRVRSAIVQNSTKTNDRTIPLNSKALSILRDLKEQNRGGREDFIINGCKNIITVDTLSDSYTNIATMAGIDNPLGIHTLRHTFASLMIRRGIDIKVVSDILGHTSTSFTYNTYVHLVQEQKAMALKLLEDI